MGGRGSYASGNRTYEYETVGTIEGVKVVRRISGSNKVPEESYTSKAYMTLYKDGNFQRLRIFDDSHKPKFDIEYHTEQSKYKNSPVLHIHTYVDGIRKPGRLLTTEEYNIYKKFFVGIVK